MSFFSYFHSIFHFLTFSPICLRFLVCFFPNRQLLYCCVCVCVFIFAFTSFFWTETKITRKLAIVKDKNFLVFFFAKSFFAPFFFLILIWVVVCFVDVDGDLNQFFFRFIFLNVFLQIPFFLPCVYSMTFFLSFCFSKILFGLYPVFFCS